jgi:radical SAM protein with 4Fe4S-binding SPASM domain
VPEINPDNYKDKDWIRYRLPAIKSTIHARNYWKNGMNRAGTVLDFDYKRTEPCTSMDKGVYIEYDGSMTACCDMIAPELHSEWTVGNLKEEPDLFKNYASEKYQGFKKRINNADWIENSPCLKCKRDIRGHKK